MIVGRTHNIGPSSCAIYRLVINDMLRDPQNPYTLLSVNFKSMEFPAKIFRYEILLQTIYVNSNYVEQSLLTTERVSIDTRVPTMAGLFLKMKM